MDFHALHLIPENIKIELIWWDSYTICKTSNAMGVPYFHPFGCK